MRNDDQGKEEILSWLDRASALSRGLAGLASSWNGRDLTTHDTIHDSINQTLPRGQNYDTIGTQAHLPRAAGQDHDNMQNSCGHLAAHSLLRGSGTPKRTGCLDAESHVGSTVALNRVRRGLAFLSVSRPSA
jgi:hypothetical protein